MENFEDFFNKYYISNTGRIRCKTYLVNFQYDLLFSQEVRKLCCDLDWKDNSFVISLLPIQYRNDFINMIKVGFTLKSTYETLKETYKF